MAASTSTAASSTVSHSNKYDQWFEVFINHRGVDVKKTFAKDLYNNLRSIGLRAFLDEDELQRGYDFPSQIEHAIGTASAHVAIFSPRYAESYWCLDELVMMLDSNKPIIPVFYGVTPAEVRWTQGKNGKYAQALQKLAEKKTDEGKLRYESSTLENWRNALSLVANISGFELQEYDIGEEVELELLDKLVKRLSEILKKPDLPVADYPTGLDDKLKHFEDTVLLQLQQSGKAQISGIWGLGGVGKTTLAKHFFNRKKSGYHRSCFLFEVKDNAADSSLKSLQSQLLKSLTGLDKEVNSVEGGKVMLTKPLKSSKVLVILDDVDKVHQVEALLPVQTHDLHPGSLILITSRNKDVLRIPGVEETSIYKLTSLNKQHSRELFCFYAFSHPYPAPGFEYLVAQFLEACDGLPLSLKVFGALLFRREISDWKEELESLQQILPDTIHGSLMISYNSLNKQEQHIFLDIACFFIGQNRDTAIEIWNKSGWRGRRGFQNLQNKCLVEVDSRNQIHMHDHVRDLRIDVAEDSSPRRVWRLTKHVLDNKLLPYEIPVRGIRMVHFEDNVFDLLDYEIAHLERIFRKLHILDTENALLERILRRVELPDLIWLRWEKCPHSSLPSWVPLKNLRFLQVSKSVLNTLWQTEGETPVLQGSLQFPVCLEELWADRCVKLKSIQGLEQLKKLRLLHVSECSDLEELPSMETLVSLEELWAERCGKLKSIMALASPTKLRLLNVSGCSDLEELPSMETLVSLEELWAEKCVKLKSIRALVSPTKLRRLHVSGCSELEELPSMETSVSLEILHAGNCVKLKSIRGLQQCTKLRDLYFSGCFDLEELPSMETLISLESLHAGECVKLKSIRGLQQCTKLRSLYFSGCSDLEELPSMETLISLKSLQAERCVKLKNIRGLERCTKLRVLYVSGCSDLEELSSLETLVSLEGLEADGCVKLNNILGLERLTKLGCLSLSGCRELEELPSMDTFVSLEGLQVDGCVKVKSIWGLEQCTKLRLLNVSGLSELEELPSMETLVSLEQLRADRCVKLKIIRGLTQCTKLRLLYVSECSELEELPSMETLVSLEELWADGSVKLKSILGLEQLTKLRRLIVNGCSELKELHGTETLVSLKDLWANGCVKLKSIRGLTQCTKLQRLFINGCFELEELPSLETLVSLKNLQADACVKLKSIRGLAQCTKLRVLSVNECYELEQLPSMETLVSLVQLRADRCVKLKSIQALAQLINVRLLYVSECFELEELPRMETLVSLEHLCANGCVKLKSIGGLLQLTKLEMLTVRGCSELEELEGVEHCTWLKVLDVSKCPKLQCPMWE